MRGKSKLALLVVFCWAAVLPAFALAGQLKAAATEWEVGAVEVTTAAGVEVKGTGVFPAESLELERVEGPPVSVRFTRIHRLTFKEVTRVERGEDSLRVAIYHLERVGGGSGIDGFIRASRPVSFDVRTKAWTKHFEIGPGNPVQQILFTDNKGRPEEGPGERKDLVLSRPGKEYTIVVPGNTSWLRTGINLTKDQHVHFSASGTIKWGTDPVGKEVGPDGQPHRGRQERPLPSRNLGMLIARIRPIYNMPYGIGAQKDFKTPATGELELGINDDELEDNTGNFRVHIVVDPA